MLVVNIIRKIKGKWYVYSEDRKKRLGGPYKTRAAAVRRLRQIEYFKQVGNAKGHEMKLQTLEFLTINMGGLVTHQTMEGREYIVVPMVMAVEGVLNGSSGPLLYPADELSKVPVSWNHKPVVVYHPDMYGKSITACDKDVINQSKIGIIMNATFDGKRLKAEAWLEEERIKAVDSRILESIENGQMMEVSTGLFTDLEETPGVFNGRDYDAIARNFRPDHLAVLPDMEGACSIKDGAGLLRLNAKHGSITPIFEQLGLVHNELSHEELRSNLYAALRAQLNGGSRGDVVDFWVVDVFDDHVIYEIIETSQNYSQDYEVTNDVVELRGLPTEVERKVVYEPVHNRENKRKDAKLMDKKTLIARVLETNKAFGKDDEAWLKSQTEAVLNKLVINEEDDPKKKTDEGDKTEEPTAGADAGANEDPNASKDPTTEDKATANKTKSVEEYINEAPPEIRESLQEGVSTCNAVRSELMSKITAHDSNKFTTDELKGMPLQMLRNVAAMIPVEEKPLLPNYAGNAPVASANMDSDDEPLPLPSMGDDGKKE